MHCSCSGRQFYLLSLCLWLLFIATATKSEPENFLGSEEEILIFISKPFINVFTTFSNCETAIFVGTSTTTTKAFIEPDGKFRKKVFHVFVEKKDLGSVLNLLSNFINDTSAINVISGNKVFIRITNPSGTGTGIKDILKEINGPTFFPINSEIFINIGNELWEVYSIKNVTVSKRLDFEIINDSSKPSSYFPTLSSRRGNLDTVKLFAVAQNDPDYQPRIKTKIYPNGSAEFEGGMCLEVLTLLQLMMNFTFRAVDGKGWVGLFPNGTWTGMSGQVVNGEADLSISQASTIMMSDQTHGISFLHPTSAGYLVAIFRQPQDSSFSRGVIRQAFQPLLWLTYFGVWVIIVLSVHVIYKINGEDFIFVRLAHLWALSTACNFGWTIVPTTVSFRIVFGLGFIMASIVCVGFNGSLVAHLANERLPIRSIKDLGESSFEIVADKWLPMAHKVLETMYKDKGRGLENIENAKEQLEPTIPHLFNRTLAFITFTDAIAVVFHRLNFSDVKYCHTIYTVRASTANYPNAMFVKRGSPLKDVLNSRILTLIERGLLSRLNRIYDLDTKIMCIHDVTAYRGGLGFMDTLLPELFIIAGLFLSLILLVVERRVWTLSNFYIEPEFFVDNNF